MKAWLALVTTIHFIKDRMIRFLLYICIGMVLWFLSSDAFLLYIQQDLIEVGELDLEEEKTEFLGLDTKLRTRSSVTIDHGFFVALFKEYQSLEVNQASDHYVNSKITYLSWIKYKELGRAPPIV